jgi:bacterioferritin
VLCVTACECPGASLWWIPGGHIKGNEKVIDQLNTALSSELTAIVQYMVQAETLQSQGYERLGRLLKQRAIEEMRHAERLIERIAFLDSQPKVDVALTPQNGQQPPKTTRDGLER